MRLSLDARLDRISSVSWLDEIFIEIAIAVEEVVGAVSRISSRVFRQRGQARLEIPRFDQVQRGRRT